MHYNSYPTAEINGGPAAGFSSGQAQAAMGRLAQQELLPNGMSFEWTELTYQQIIAGNTAVLVFSPLVVLLVLLVLAAQYESLSLPLAVILIMPMVLLSAITGVELTHGDNNIFYPDRLTMVLVGLASKNAILIVEFARDRELEGTIAGTSGARCQRGCGCGRSWRPHSLVHHGRGAAGHLEAGQVPRCAMRWVSPCSRGCWV